MTIITNAATEPPTATPRTDFIRKENIVKGQCTYKESFKKGEERI